MRQPIPYRAAEIDAIEQAVMDELPDLPARRNRQIKAAKESTVSGELRRAVRDSDWRLNSLARELEIDPILFEDCLCGDAPLPFTAVDKLGILVHRTLVVTP